MVTRDHSKFFFILETLDFVQEAQMYEILAYSRSFGIKLSFAQILIVIAIVCLCACACACSGVHV